MWPSFAGYVNDPVATANTIDEEGFLHTGDIAIIDDDEEVFIVDRVKEIIKYKGFQVACVRNTIDLSDLTFIQSKLI